MTYTRSHVHTHTHIHARARAHTQKERDWLVVEQNSSVNRIYIAPEDGRTGEVQTEKKCGIDNQTFVTDCTIHTDYLLCGEGSKVGGEGAGGE